MTSAIRSSRMANLRMFFTTSSASAIGPNSSITPTRSPPAKKTSSLPTCPLIVAQVAQVPPIVMPNSSANMIQSGAALRSRCGGTGRTGAGGGGGGGT
jgi:hypothetical protein